MTPILVAAIGAATAQHPLRAATNTPASPLSPATVATAATAATTSPVDRDIRSTPVVARVRLTHVDEPATSPDQRHFEFQVEEVLVGELDQLFLVATVAPGVETSMVRAFDRSRRDHGVDTFLPTAEFVVTLIPRGHGWWVRAATRAETSDPDGPATSPATGPLLALSPSPSPLAPSPDSAQPAQRALSQQSTQRGTSSLLEQQVVEIVNEERWTFNSGMLPPLKHNALLDNSSGGHSQRMAEQNFFAHCDYDNLSTSATRITAAGYVWNASGENIAAGLSSASAIMELWMSSIPHRNNILSTNYRDIGVGHFYQAGDQNTVRLHGTNPSSCVPDSLGNGPYFNYWTQNFGRNPSTYPMIIERETITTDDAFVDLYLYGAGTYQSMRFSNDGISYSDWETFTPDKAWILSPGAGTKTVYAQRATGAGGSGSVGTVTDTIEYSGADGHLFSDGFESGTTSAWS